MSTVKEIESAISRLSHDEISELRVWFTEFADDAWDRQVETDAQSGRLDALYQRLQKESKAEPDIPLDDVLNKEELS